MRFAPSPSLRLVHKLNPKISPSLSLSLSLSLYSIYVFLFIYICGYGNIYPHAIVLGKSAPRQQLWGSNPQKLRLALWPRSGARPAAALRAGCARRGRLCQPGLGWKLHLGPLVERFELRVPDFFFRKSVLVGEPSQPKKG